MAKKRKTAKERQEEVRAARQVSFEEYIEEIRALHESEQESDSEAASTKEAAAIQRGACLIRSAGTGGSVCVRTTPAACKQMKGVFIGGPCGV